MKLDPCRLWVCLPFRSLRPTRSPARQHSRSAIQLRLYSAGHDWQAGETFRLLRTETVVLTFFPAAFTTRCTKEMTSFASDIEKFRGANAEVLPTSTDNSPTLKRRAEELKASYIMLSDFQRNVSAQYGVLIPIVDWRTGPPLSLIRMGESSTLTRGRLPSTSVAPRDRAIV